jgi:putative ABC transport system substrate-binding protein
VLYFEPDRVILMQADYMKRRQFITLLGGAAAAWPLAARAQQPALPVVGYFHPGLEEPGAPILTPAFRKGLGELGFVEGRDLAIEYRFGRNDPSRTSELIADLVRRKVAVLATLGGPGGALAAKAATTTIPIVFEIGSDPVEIGLVASFNRPGGNVTGIAALNGVLDAKRLGLLVELVPAVARIGVLLTTVTSVATQARLRELPRAAAALGRQIEVLPAPDSREIETVFASLAEKRIDALYVPPNPIYGSLRVQIATAAARHAIPVVYGERLMVDAGGLMSYGADTADDWRIVGTYVGRILKGEKPADLPVQQPIKFELAINLKTAKALGLAVPDKLLALADEVIE